ncbi:MAG: helix-turn-helix domain-containing protein [Bacillota bacterium]
MSVSKDELYRLIEALPERETPVVRRFLEFVLSVAERELTPEQASARLGVSPRKVRQWLRQGLLPGRKAGREWRIKESELEPYLDPVARTLLMAPEDDESTTPEEDARSEKAWREYLRGHTVSHEKARKEIFGK